MRKLQSALIVLCVSKLADTIGRDYVQKGEGDINPLNSTRSEDVVNRKLYPVRIFCCSYGSVTLLKGFSNGVVLFGTDEEMIYSRDSRNEKIFIYKRIQPLHASSAKIFSIRYDLHKWLFWLTLYSKCAIFPMRSYSLFIWVWELDVWNASHLVTLIYIYRIINIHVES